jgi:hypothetical protein
MKKKNYMGIIEDSMKPKDAHKSIPKFWLPFEDIYMEAVAE